MKNKIFSCILIFLCCCSTRLTLRDINKYVDNHIYYPKQISEIEGEYSQNSMFDGQKLILYSNNNFILHFISDDIIIGIPNEELHGTYSISADTLLLKFTGVFIEGTTTQIDTTKSNHYKNLYPFNVRYNPAIFLRSEGGLFIITNSMKQSLISMSYDLDKLLAPRKNPFGILLFKPN